eukprot:CAMPEP_0177731474 /NCGR_PEP_ID=MMETSP0484_2-20121128/22575_1 /TAXON_ID=354590 /ORGANISM="Rhodomonas lens, Strain RHODO" /LENGTH=299 /DNA_ID=CAMNT_0019244599 /DNA_START=42 /DNA_END=938 /DNA_ORIENTATION=+
MNVKTALGVVGVLELLTLVALGHYSTQLHGLQEKRSGLVAREDDLRRTLLSATALPQSPNLSPSNKALASPSVKPVQDLSPKSSESQTVDQNDTGEEADDSLPPEDIGTSVQKAANIPDSNSIPGANAAQDSNGAQQAKAASGATQDNRQPSVQPMALPAVPQQPPQPLKAQQAPPSQLPPSEIAHVAVAQPAVPAAAVPQNFGFVAPSSASSSFGGAEGEGEFAVTWHDGTLHWRRFARFGDASDFYGTLSDEIAHRLTRRGKEIKRHNWADDPWPPAWEAPEPPSDPAPSSSSNPSP